MSQSLYNQKNQLTKSMTEQQFEEIVGAIVAGKYSWACVLILQTAGYNPLHYIPYRTYNRLLKDNRLKKENSEQQKTNQLSSKSSVARGQNSTQMRKISYVESLDKSESKILGNLGCEQMIGR
ncbi:HetP family heterocyst commitment protein [Crocosphaera sp. Alani8]|uniref:HetP family heterocyst commitment protein n=1 Tax=Crocosphaera sp. Alani8 TaxID=3038952 RepID=UPI00313BC655